MPLVDTLYKPLHYPDDGENDGRREIKRTFPIEMRSKDDVRNISLSNESHGGEFFEGNLGEIEELSIVEGAMLEVRGSNGVLRVEISEAEMMKVLPRNDNK